MKQRDHRVDSLRGLFLAIMVLDHLQGPLRTLTWEPFGYVSAAEGFVLLSGFVFAVVYGRHVNSPSLLLRKGLARAGKIYKYQLVLVTTISCVALWVPPALEYWRSMLSPFDHNPLKYTILEALLLHQPLYMDILPMYILFALLGPPILYAYHRGKAPLVLGVSLSLWLLSQFINLEPYRLGPFYSQVNPGYFKLFAWQLLWVLGLGLGMFRERLHRHIVQAGMKSMLAVGAAAVALLVLRHHGATSGNAMAMLLDKPDLGPLRLFNVVVLVVIVARLLCRVPMTAGVSWLALLGRNALFAFSVHVGAMYFLQPVSWRVQYFGGDAVYAVYTVAVVAGIYWAAYFHERHRVNASLRAGKRLPQRGYRRT